jgi:hypothetical protein
MSDLEMKSFGPFEIKSEDRGEVVAIVATLGVVDKDGDVIMPGSFPAGGSRVKLSGYGHDVVTEGRAPVGKGVVTEENGHAIFKGQFFMSTQRGREAFHTTKELGADGEWSFGFPKTVRTGEMTDEWRAKGAKRVIAGLTPIEASPVFVGAGWGTGTLLTKAAEDVAPEPKSDDEVDGLIDGVKTIAEKLDEILDVAVLDAAHAAEPEESAEAKAAREAELAHKAAKAEAMEEYARVQRALKRMGYAA